MFLNNVNQKDDGHSNQVTKILSTQTEEPRTLCGLKFTVTAMDLLLLNRVIMLEPIQAANADELRRSCFTE